VSLHSHESNASCYAVQSDEPFVGPGGADAAALIFYALKDRTAQWAE